MYGVIDAKNTSRKLQPKFEFYFYYLFDFKQVENKKHISITYCLPFTLLIALHFAIVMATLQNRHHHVSQFPDEETKGCRSKVTYSLSQSVAGCHVSNPYVLIPEPMLCFEALPFTKLGLHI